MKSEGGRDGLTVSSRTVCFGLPLDAWVGQEVQACNSGVSNTQSAFVETPGFDTEVEVD